MAEPKSNELMEKIVSLCKRRGFVFQSSEIYGGINGFWDYGPLGAELKRNVKELWWNTMTRQREDVVGLEATIIMAPQIWRASGHVDTFADMMVECPITKKRFRADQVEPQSGVIFTFFGAINGETYVKQAGHVAALGVKGVYQEWVDHFLAIEGLPRHDEMSQERRHALSTHDFNLLNQGQQRQILDRSTLPKEFWEQLEAISTSWRAATIPFSRDSISVLVREPKNLNKARQVAKEFYKSRGVENAWLIESTSEPSRVEQSQRFNPENGVQLTEPRPFNLMFKTYVGPVADEDNVAYLRPETAQAIFAQFKNVLETSRQKVPFGIAQVGKAFRNEVTPRNFTFRSREFEQMELEFFIKPDEAIEAIHGSVATVPESGHPGEPQPNWGWQAWHQYWVEERVRFYEGIGLSRQTLGFHRQTPEELAHYARACVDILFKFPFSKRDEKGELLGEELEGIAARSDFDLSQHERFSSKPMGVFDEELRTAWGKLDEAKRADLSKRYENARLKYLTKMGVDPAKAAKEAKEDADGLAKGQYIPHVIEPSAGVDRLILALVANAYTEVTETDDKGKSETRVIMKFHPRVAPIKVGVMPLLKNKPELVKKALEVRDLLRPHLNVYYDDAGSIGRRYARQDEAGTPYCVTIDFDTLGEKPELLNTVTLRHRDDGRQERLAIGELLNWLQARIR